MQGESGGMPVEYQSKMQNISRQLKIADALRAQSQQMPQGQMVSGHYVAPHFTQYLAQALKGYNANASERDAEKKQTALYTDYQSKQNNASQALIEGLRGQEVQTGTNTTMPAYQPEQMDRFGSPKQGAERTPITTPIMTRQAPTPNDMMSAALEYAQKTGNTSLVNKLAEKNYEGALKTAYPKMGDGKNEYVYYPTEKGMGYFNKSDKADFGYLSGEGGSPVIRSQDSPAIRGAVKNAESRAGANYRINDSIDGARYTDSQVSDMARGGASNTEQSTGISNAMQIPPDIQSQRDATRLNILLAEQKNLGGYGQDQYLDKEITNEQQKQGIKSSGGFKVPTKAEQAFAQQNAKNQSDLNFNPKIAEATSSATEKGKLAGKDAGAAITRQDALSSVKRAAALLDGGIYAGGYANLKSSVAKYTPFGDEQRLANTQEFISEIGNTVVPRLQEFGGNDSNEEMKYLKGIMGGDITSTPAALKAVLKNVEFKIKRGIERSKNGINPDGTPKSLTTPTRRATDKSNSITVDY